MAARAGDLLGALDAFLAGDSSAQLLGARASSQAARKLAFVFSGMGPQWWGMGRQLISEEPVFREILERCDAALRPYAGWSLLEELSADEAASRVAHPQLAQVTNFALQVGLAELWTSWGIVPDAVIGHSGGAMAAAYVAGVYDLEAALRLAYHRSRLQGRESNGGRMLAVGLPGYGSLGAVQQHPSSAAGGSRRADAVIERDARAAGDFQRLSRRRLLHNEMRAVTSSARCGTRTRRVTCREAAHRLRTREATITTRLYRGRRHLRGLLGAALP